MSRSWHKGRLALILCVVFAALALGGPVAALAAVGVSTGDGTWVWQNPLPQGERLFDVAFANPTTGWAVGQSGAIMLTTDGGDSWSGQDSGTTWNLTKVSFPDAQNGWIIGRSELESQALLSTKVLLHTTDGGQTWQRARLPGSQWPYTLADVCFVDAQHGWLLGFTDGYGDYILHTTDGGSTWQFEEPELVAPLRAIHFTDQQHGWAVGWN